MLTVGVKVLKNSLSAHLREVAAGRTVLVTDRGQVVAELGPPRAAANASLAQQRLADLVRSGTFTPALASSPRPRLPRRKPTAPLHAVLQDLQESRDGR